METLLSRNDQLWEQEDFGVSGFVWRKKLSPYALVYHHGCRKKKAAINSFFVVNGGIVPKIGQKSNFMEDLLAVYSFFDEFE